MIYYNGFKSWIVMGVDRGLYLSISMGSLHYGEYDGEPYHHYKATPDYVPGQEIIRNIFELKLVET